MQQQTHFTAAASFRRPLIALCAILCSCGEPGPTGNEMETLPEQNLSVTLPGVSPPAAPLDRSDLLLAVAKAASAAAAGTEDREADGHLDGATFELRIRFGCRGPSAALRNEDLGWDVDEARRRLRVRASPTISAEEDLAERFATNGFEAMEGFWIPRPWLLDAVCPAATAEPLQPAMAEDESQAGKAAPVAAKAKRVTAASQAAGQPVGPRTGIAQFFTSSESRVRRRSSRAYEATKALEPDQAISAQGFNLVLSGRLKALPDGSVISCTANSPDLPPDCLISAQFDKVWIETPDSGDVLAQWGSG